MTVTTCHQCSGTGCDNHPDSGQICSLCGGSGGIEELSMTNPKMKPCPKCGTDEALAVYKYDSGWRHVECDECMYLGPGEGSVRQAIKAHNDRVAQALLNP